MKLDETVNYVSLEVGPYVGATLYSLFVPSGFGGRAGFDVTSFLRVCWQLSPWEEVGLDMGGLGPEPGVTWFFPSALWLSLPY